jgi:hypothetical protein
MVEFVVNVTPPVTSFRVGTAKPVNAVVSVMIVIT